MNRQLNAVVGVVFWLVAAGAAGAHAAEDPEALIREGVELRHRGEDVKAHGYFQRAYDFGHTPRAAAQLGLVNEALGYYFEAERYLTEALETQDPWVLKHRSILEKSRQTVRAHLGKIELRGLPSDATVAWAGQAPQAIPSNNVLWVVPGKVTLTFAAPDRTPVTKVTSVDQGESAALQIDLPPVAPPVVAAQPAPVAEPPAGVPAPAPTPEPTTPSSADDGKPLRIAGLITGGAGVLVGVAGIFVYRAGVSKRDAIMRDASAPMPSYNDSNADYRTLGSAGIGLIVGGVVAVATGVVLYLVGRSTGSESAEGGTHVSFGYTPGSGGRFLVGGSF